MKSKDYYRFIFAWYIYLYKYICHSSFSSHLFHAYQKKLSTTLFMRFCRLIKTYWPVLFSCKNCISYRIYTLVPQCRLIRKIIHWGWILSSNTILDTTNFKSDMITIASSCRKLNSDWVLVDASRCDSCSGVLSFAKFPSLNRGDLVYSAENNILRLYHIRYGRLSKLLSGIDNIIDEAENFLTCINKILFCLSTLISGVILNKELLSDRTNAN